MKCLITFSDTWFELSSPQPWHLPIPFCGQNKKMPWHHCHRPQRTTFQQRQKTTFFGCHVKRRRLVQGTLIAPGEAQAEFKNMKQKWVLPNNVYVPKSRRPELNLCNLLYMFWGRMSHVSRKSLNLYCVNSGDTGTTWPRLSITKCTSRYVKKMTAATSHDDQVWEQQIILIPVQWLQVHASELVRFCQNDSYFILMCFVIPPT